MDAEGAVQPEAAVGVADSGPIVLEDDSGPQLKDIRFNTNKMRSTHIMALDKLIEYQCSQLEKRLTDLRMKRKKLHDGGVVTVSLEELISDRLIEAAEVVVAPKSGESSTSRIAMHHPQLQPSEEIKEIIDSINSRKAEEEGSVASRRRVQFTANDASHESVFARIPRRCTTLPELRKNATPTNEVQLMLHMQGTCKPCAFYYNKKKGCRNGQSCGFCHHEDHSLCSLKQWKKQQKLFSQSASLSSEKLVDMFGPNQSPH